MRLSRTILLAAAVVTFPAQAFASPFSMPVRGLAQSPMEEAKAEYELGSKAYTLGNYEEAVQHFERSFDLSHRSELLYDIGMSYQKWFDVAGDVGHLRKAKKLFENYRLFIEEHPEAAKEHLDAAAQIEAIDAKLEEAEAEGPDPGPGPGPGPGPDPGPGEGDGDDDRAVYQKGWFWGAVIGGALMVAGGVTLAVVLSQPQETFEPELGTLGDQGGGVVFRF